VSSAITDKSASSLPRGAYTLVGRGAVTPRTRALARQHLDLRLAILPALPPRLAELRTIRNDEQLCAQVAELNVELDGHLTVREIEDLVRQGGFPALHIVAHVGYSASERQRVRAPATLGLAAEYFRLRLCGFSSARAHTLVADRHQYSVEAIRVFRQRFRDDAKEILPE
jgi:hypothetical protein